MKIWKMTLSDHNKQQYEKAMAKKVVSLGRTTGKGGSASENFKNAEKGDLFYLLRNSNEVLLIGRFNTDFVTESDLRDGDIERSYEVVVEATKNQVEKFGQEGWMPSGQTTFFEIPEDKYQQFEEKILKPNFNMLLKNLGFNSRVCKYPPSDKGTEGEKMTALNTILFGPPGTGKTYKTIDHALSILMRSDKVPDNRTEAKKVFDAYVTKGQIVFTTFHQSYGYEEFIEGIKPDMESDDGQVRYEIKDGIFKELCNKAISQNNDQAFHKKIDWLKIECSEADGKDPLDLGTFTISYRNGRTFRVKPKNSTKDDPDYPASIENIEKLYKGGNRSDVYNPTYVSGILNYLYDNGLPKFEANKESTQPSYNYVIIIDEINRGNISKIFGELITLIEPSKRLGADEAMTVKLPYSGDSFGVPSNVHIIGTMNTADRSIALMDTALRRRFEFIEMMPKPELLQEVTIKDEQGKEHTLNLKKLLEVINCRISYLYDRDHQIGHAYFMSLLDDKVKDKKAELDNIFRNKIIPLLQEYFYDDWEKIQIVLGDHDKQFDQLYKDKQANKSKDRFIESSQLTQKGILGFDDQDDDIADQATSYIIRESFTENAYLKITGGLPKQDSSE